MRQTDLKSLIAYSSVAHISMVIGGTTVTLASTNNALPDDGVTAAKRVGAVLMSILM
jgi:NADH:ubiquinone oxidoreductase subunit 4 (subunit M)